MLASKIKEIRNGRVIVKDSKVRDANPDGTISPDEEKRMAELLREANESKSRLKAKAYEIGGSFRGPGNWKRVKSILTSDSKTKDKYDLVWQNDKYEVYEDENREFELVRKSDKSVVGQYATLQGAKLEASESSKVDAHLSKTKDAKTKHEYKGYVLEWDNENNKIPAKIISPKGQVIFTYAVGAEPTITGFNSKVELDLSKTKDANIVNAGNIKGINWEVRKDIKNGNVIYIGESDLDDMTYEGAYPAQVAKELMNWIRGHAGN
jgi:hypothetical protein